jgi:hypothetical protein
MEVIPTIRQTLQLTEEILLTQFPAISCPPSRRPRLGCLLTVLTIMKIIVNPLGEPLRPAEVQIPVISPLVLEASSALACQNAQRTAIRNHAICTLLRMCQPFKGRIVGWARCLQMNYRDLVGAHEDLGKTPDGRSKGCVYAPSFIPRHSPVSLSAAAITKVRSLAG